LEDRKIAEVDVNVETNVPFENVLKVSLLLVNAMWRHVPVVDPGESIMLLAKKDEPLEETAKFVAVAAALTPIRMPSVAFPLSLEYNNVLAVNVWKFTQNSMVKSALP
jgi:hypothetical protein